MAGRSLFLDIILPVSIVSLACAGVIVGWAVKVAQKEHPTAELATEQQQVRTAEDKVRIAARLAMGRWTYVSDLLVAYRKEPEFK